MKKVLRYGMVGGGPGSFIGDAHRRAIALDSTAELVAGVFSSHPEKSRETAEALGLDPARCYADYREMAEKEASRPDGIDFVVVVTPNISHFEICKAFLNAGIHVSCDKPVTVTYAQAAELEQLAADLLGDGLVVVIPGAPVHQHLLLHRVGGGQGPGGQ